MKRIIPSIVVDEGKVFHRIKFKNNIYLGDPINMARIYNDKNCDEIVFFDVSKNESRSLLATKKLVKISENVFVPISYGGGIHSKYIVDNVFASGIEKIIFTFNRYTNYNLINYCANKYGEQSIVLNINLYSNRHIFFKSNKFIPAEKLWSFTSKIIDIPHGELLIQFVDLSGTNAGSAIDFSKKLRNQFLKPLIYSGGITKYDEIKSLFDIGVDAVACSTIFSLHSVTGAPLISYLDWEERLKLNLI